VLGSCSEVHDAITGVVGSWQKTIDGIKRCLKVKMHITPNIVMSKANALDILATAKMLATIGCNDMQVDFASRPSNCSDFSAFDLTCDEKINVLKHIDIINQHCGIKAWNLARIPFCLVPELTSNLEYFSPGCGAGKSGCNIGADGIARACAMEQAISIKSINDFSLIDLWQEFDERGTDTYVPVDCRDCKLLYKCGGGCRFAGCSATGRKDGCDPLMKKVNVERVFKMLLSHQQDVQQSITHNTKITFSNFGIRDEEFGAVVWNGRTQQFVNISGKSFLRNIVVGKEYLLNRNISENYKEFLTDLVIGGFASVS
jgi:radical SAM protein with 4Fe4S-binding SPASM domain